MWASAVLVAVVCGTEAGVLAVDTKPEVYLAPARTAVRSLSAWQETPSLGLASFQVGLAPVAAFVAVLELAGLPPWLSVRVLRCLLLLLGALGAARLTRLLVTSARSSEPVVAGRFAGLAYVLNPYVVVAGASLPVLWPYALLPWQLLTLCRAVAEPRSWRWPAAFALTVLLATGQNAGAVPALQLAGGLAVVLVYARAVGTRWQVTGRVLARGAVLAVVASAYWLLPSIAAAGAGATVVSGSESPTAIAATSGFQEVVRGLGLWPLYGSDGRGAWVPEHAAYLTSPWLVVLTFCVPAVALALAATAAPTVRRAGIVTLVVAASLMVGAHDADGQSAAGRLWAEALDLQPALGVLRTTNKAGAALVLAVALLVGAGLAGIHGRAGQAAKGLVVALLAAACVPAWTGGLFTSRVSVPAYWQEAAAAVDGNGRTDRVWFLPGQVSANYRWSEPRPDDLGNSLFERPTVAATTIPITSPQGANLLSALDAALQDGVMPAQGLASAARYLGVGDVLVRNDLRWEDARGAPPAVVAAQVAGSAGLTATGSFGSAEEGAGAERSDGSLLPALQAYSVERPESPVRLEPLAGSVVVDGDGAALPLLAQVGLLPDEPLFRYATDTSADELAEVLRSGGRVVLTDTNRRVERTQGVLSEGNGPLLAAADAAPGSLVLGRPEEQTVVDVRGAVARSDRIGSVFGLVPWASPQNVLDGDSATGWWFGDFGSAVGAHVDIDYGAEVDLGSVEVSVTSQGASAIREVAAEAGGRSATARVGPDGVARLALPGVRSATLSLEVTEADRGDGALVGVSEVDVGAVASQRRVRLPGTLSERLQELGPDDQEVAARAPLDVLLHRVSGGPGPADDEEVDLSRDFELPWEARLSPSAVVSLARPMPEAELDRAEGTAPGVEATSSSQAFDLPTVRASMALDGDEGTGWSPAEPAVGETIQVRLPVQELSSLSFRQPDSGRLVTRVRVERDGRDAGSFPVGPGSTVLELPAEPAGEVRITLEAVSEGDGPVRILELGVGDARVTRDLARGECFTIATVNRAPVQVRLTAPASATSVLVAGCPGADLDLGAGDHRWRPVGGWVVDTVVLRDVGRSTTAGAAAQAVQVRPDGLGPGWTGQVPATAEPMVLVSGVGFDPRWRLSLSGEDLGGPVVVNGHTAGWVVPAGDPRTARLTYEPQSLVWAGIAVSGVAVVVLVILLRHGPTSTRPTSTRPMPPRDPRRHRRDGVGRRRWEAGAVAPALVLVAATGLVAGLPGLAAATAGAGCSLLGWRRPVLVASVLTLLAVPVAWLVGNASRLGEVTPALVLEVPLAHHLTAVALALAVTWAVVERRGVGHVETGQDP